MNIFRFEISCLRVAILARGVVETVTRHSRITACSVSTAGQSSGTKLTENRFTCSLPLALKTELEALCSAPVPSNFKDRSVLVKTKFDELFSYDYKNNSNLLQCIL